MYRIRVRIVEIVMMMGTTTNVPVFEDTQDITAEVSSHVNLRPFILPKTHFKITCRPARDLLLICLQDFSSFCLVKTCYEAVVAQSILSKGYPNSFFKVPGSSNKLISQE